MNPGANGGANEFCSDFGNCGRSGGRQVSLRPGAQARQDFRRDGCSAEGWASTGMQGVSWVGLTSPQRLQMYWPSSSRSMGWWWRRSILHHYVFRIGNHCNGFGMPNPKCNRAILGQTVQNYCP